MREAVEFFHKTELSELHDTFDQLCRVQTPKGDGAAKQKQTSHGIDKEIFKRYFNYPGVLRDQIFKVFDARETTMAGCDAHNRRSHSDTSARFPPPSFSAAEPRRHDRPDRVHERAGDVLPRPRGREAAVLL
jgi:hypothetical protein